MELNTKDIIKGLESCTRGRKSKDDRPCLECPYNECNIVGGTNERQIKGTCQGWLMKDALALIKQLTEDAEWSAKRILEADKKVAELTEKAQKDWEGYILTAELLYDAEQRCAKLTEENERLSVQNKIFESNNKSLEFDNDTLIKCNTEIRADTVREMQEWLKKRIASAKYSAKTDRKTVKKEELIEQVNWVFHKVVPDTIDQIAKEMLEGKGD